ncbi:MAG TPA: hypothetical protein VFX28_13660, partial [Methylomirabilota bacterium]|nr:hypothetical protein [Methylomirabilota bacterium]
MKRGPIVVAVLLAVLAGLAFAPRVASAQRSLGRHTGDRTSVRGHHGSGRHGFGHHAFGHRFGHHPFVARPFFPVIPFGIVSSPVVVYAPPAFYAPPPVAYAPPPVYAPPVVYGAPPAGSVALAPAPAPTVVHHPTGRYELR